MINIQTIQHVADCVPLYLPHSLYLKPVAKLNISVALPSNKTGKSISNLDIMDKLSRALKPDKFLVLKVSKSTVDFIRFEAELHERSRLRNALNRLDGISLKISGFHEGFRVRASEPKDEFPSRHDWDSFFRDAHNMDEMKAGERPDTIHITHLPIKWFCPRHMENEDNVKPSESIFKRIFEKFGSVHMVDIPICDPYRNKMNNDINGMKTFSFEQDVLFEAYIQFDEYVGFVRAMDEFRGMKLVRKFVDKTQAINITVNFDTTKHLSDAQIQRRERVRKRLIAKTKAEEDEIERQKKLEQEKLEHQRQMEEQAKQEELEKQHEREQKRKEKHLKKIQEKGQAEISQKIRVEERKLMIAQRKLESIRILEKIFDRLKLKHMAKHPTSSSRKQQLDMQRDIMRERLVQKYKVATEKLLCDQKKKVEDIKNNTPLMGLLKRKKGKHSSDDSENDNAKNRIANDTPAGSAAPINADDMNSLNPFKTMAAMNAANYNTDAASEWMKSLSMFPYAPPMFPGLGMYRPPTFPVSMNYRGFAPRMRARGRGRGRGRGGYDGQSSSHYNNHKYYNHDDRDHRYDDEDGGGGNYHKYSRGRHYSRSRSRDRRSRSRSRSRSRRTRSRSRSRGRSRHYSKRSRSRSRSHSRSYSRSVSRSRSRSRVKSKDDKNRKLSRSKSPSGSVHQKPVEKTNRRLVSTRRSRSSSDWSRGSRSRSRTRSKRSWSKRGSKERRSSPTRKVVIETDKLVRSAEEIKRTIERDMQDRMREEEREIKETFNKSHKQVMAHNAAIAENLLAGGIDSGIGTAEHSATESSVNNSNTKDKHENDHDDDEDNEENNKKSNRERRDKHENYNRIDEYNDNEVENTKKSHRERRDSSSDRHRSSRRNSMDKRHKSRRNSSCERSPTKRGSLDRRNSSSRHNSSERRQISSRRNSSEREGSNC